MKAEDLKKHFERSGKNVVFVFEESLLARDDTRNLDLGPDTEVVTYEGDAFAMKRRIRLLSPEKRLVVLVAGPSPLATGGDPVAFPLLGELMANGEYKAQTPVSFLSENGMNTADTALVSFVPL